jgi:predicted MFS family arabinose efflux permease
MTLRANIDHASHDPRGLVAPIAVAEQPLVELAGRQPRQLGLVVGSCALALFAGDPLTRSVGSIFKDTLGVDL